VQTSSFFITCILNSGIPEGVPRPHRMLALPAATSSGQAVDAYRVYLGMYCNNASALARCEVTSKTAPRANFWHCCTYTVRRCRLVVAHHVGIVPSGFSVLRSSCDAADLHILGDRLICSLRSFPLPSAITTGASQQKTLECIGMPTSSWHFAIQKC
jgi:hypothetical protein